MRFLNLGRWTMKRALICVSYHFRYYFRKRVNHYIGIDNCNIFFFFKLTKLLKAERAVLLCT